LIEIGRRIVPALCLVLVACTSITVEPLRSEEGARLVCVEDNPEVLVADFLKVVRAGFKRHGIDTLVFDEAAPAECELILQYTALRSWDLTPFLSHAELSLERDGVEVARGVFHLRGKGGYALTKYQSTSTKMDPVIDPMLAEYAVAAGR
jgi:hypothetical protein